MISQYFYLKISENVILMHWNHGDLFVTCRFLENRKKNRSQRSAKNVSNCSHHLIEHCPLPQWCNSFCPTFRNQYNGKEIDFFKVFAASGMDSKGMADLLGVNMSTVTSMNANTISTLLLDTFRHKQKAQLNVNMSFDYFITYLMQNVIMVECIFIVQEMDIQSKKIDLHVHIP